MIKESPSTLRIIGGTWRGKRLEGTTPDLPTRPTSDRLRESIFNLLIHLTPPTPLPGVTTVRRLGAGGGLFAMPITVLDGFAGTGAMGLEALSRGALSVTFIENHPSVFDLLKRNIALCGANQRAQPLRANMLKLAKPFLAPFDLIFLDPPYTLGAAETLAHLEKMGAFQRGTLVVLEQAAPACYIFPETWQILKETTTRAALVQIAQFKGETL